MRVYPITPVAAPRMTQADRWKKRPCVMRYRAFRDEVRWHQIKVGDTLDVTFRLPMPKTWSKKKKGQMMLNPHKQKPDIDNLVKALLDAALAEDCHVHTIKANKIWDTSGAIVIR